MNRMQTLAAAVLATAAAFTSFGAQAQTSGYDYASKFYPHPAWLYLKAEAPREMGQHPAVLVVRRAAQGEVTVAEANQRIYPHPAWGYLSTEPSHEMGQHPAVLVARQSQEAQIAEARAAAASATVARLDLAQR